MMATELWRGGLHTNSGWEVTKHGGDGVSVNCGGTRNGTLWNTGHCLTVNLNVFIVRKLMC